MSKKLKKAFERVDGVTLVDPREYYGARQVASKQLMSWLSKEVSDLAQDESLTLDIPQTTSKLKVRKVHNDMYSGWIINPEGDITHEYNKLTIPALVTQIEAVEELYLPEEDEKEEKPEPKSKEEKKPEDVDLTPILDKLQELSVAVKGNSQEVPSEPEPEPQAEPKDDISTLKEQLAGITKDLQNSEAKRGAVESKLNGLISKLAGLSELLDVEKSENDESIDKLKKFRDEMASSVGIAKAYMVDQLGSPDPCLDCRHVNCICFSHLSSPVISKSNGKTKIDFGKDFNNMDRLNYLKQMQYAINKKLTKNMEKAMDLPPPPPAIERPGPEKEFKQHRNEDVHLRAIADVETAGGKHLQHPEVKAGIHAGQRAGGSWALMPKTARAIINGTMGAHDLKDKHGHLLGKSHSHITRQLTHDFELSRELAGSHHAWLMGKLGNDHKKVAHAWYNGLGATRKASDKDIDAHPYVQKYIKSYEKHKIVQQAEEQTGRDPFQRPPGMSKALKKNDNVSSVALMSGNKILMGQRRDNSKWTLPGGHANDGESKEDCAVRELAEETGVSRSKAKFKFLVSKPVSTPDGKKMIHAFKVNVNTPSTTMLGDPDEEVERWHWVDVEDGYLPSHIGGNLHSPKNITLEALDIKPELDRKFKKYDYTIYDEIAKAEDTKGNVFVAFDGDNIGAKVEQAAMRDDLDGIKEMHESILRGQKVIRDYGKKWGADIYIDGGDDIAMVIDRKALKELENVRKDYKKVTGHSVTAGIGNRISRAGHALLFGKLTGKDKTVVWSEEVNEKLDEVRRDLTPAEKLADHGLLTAGADND